MREILVAYPCASCPDDECGERGCAQYETAAAITFEGQRLARLVSESALPDNERRRAGVIFCDAVTEALGLCSAHLDRASFLEACRLEVTT